VSGSLDDAAEAATESATGPAVEADSVAHAADETIRAAALHVLLEGEIAVAGRLTAASNLTFLCRVRLDDPAGGRPRDVTAIYKPIRGEAPLWDFPDGTLANREVAAYLVSEATGWGIVPPTVLRDGPWGPGMVQLWMDVDETVDVVELIRSAVPALRPMAVFDAVVNNGDRKAGHLLPVDGGRIHGVDHGVCFSTEPKLRTVLWGWMGVPLGRPELAVLRRLRNDLDGPLGEALGRLLARDEVAATARRTDRLLATGRFPTPDHDRPAIPWPWY